MGLNLSQDGVFVYVLSDFGILFSNDDHYIQIRRIGCINVSSTDAPLIFSRLQNNCYDYLFFGHFKMGIDYTHVNKSVHTIKYFTPHKYTYSKLLRFLLHYILPCISTFIVLPPPAVKYYCYRCKINPFNMLLYVPQLFTHTTNIYVFLLFAKHIIMYIDVYIYYHTTI